MIKRTHFSRAIMGALAVSSATALAMFGAMSRQSRTGPAPDQVLNRNNLVFVYEGLPNQGMPGCAGITAFDVKTGEIVYQGPSSGGHGDMGARSDMSIVVAGWNQGSSGSLYWVDASADDPRQWEAGTEMPPTGRQNMATKSGVAIPVDGQSVVFGETSAATGVARYLLSDVPNSRFSRQSGFFLTKNDYSDYMIADPLRDVVYTLSDSGRAYVLSAADLSTREDGISFPRLVVDAADPRGNFRGRQLYASISPDLRTIVVNRWNVPELSAIDLKYGKTYTFTVASDLMPIGGVAFNWSWNNYGLLALHAGDTLAVYEFEPGTVPLGHELSRVKIDPPLDAYKDLIWPGRIAWSTDGLHLIAAASHGKAEYVVMDVSDCGRSLTTKYYFTACPSAGSNQALGLITGNGLLPTPESAAMSCPTPWWNPLPSSTPESATAGTTTPTATTTVPTTMVERFRAWLPLLLEP